MNLKKLAGRSPKTSEERFHLSYKRDKSGCWIWQGKSRSGSCRLYGRIKVNGKAVIAHRYAWELYNGEIPDRALVLHKCDNPECVNPSHLFLGTQQDNMNDKVSKNRQAKGDSFKNRPAPIGEINGNSKITETQAKNIFLDTRSQKKIATEYGITQAAVSSIKSLKTWRKVNV